MQPEKCIPLFLEINPQKKIHSVSNRGGIGNLDVMAALTVAIIDEGNQHGNILARGNDSFKDHILKAAENLGLLIDPIKWTGFPGQSGTRLVMTACWQPRGSKPRQAGIIYKHGRIYLAKGDACLLKVPEAQAFIAKANNFLTPSFK